MGRRRAGGLLTARGEFSIIIAALGLTAGAPPRLSAIAAGYVLVTATAGPISALIADRWAQRSSPSGVDPTVRTPDSG